jgi:hypothetical protein
MAQAFSISQGMAHAFGRPLGLMEGRLKTSHLHFFKRTK